MILLGFIQPFVYWGGLKLSRTLWSFLWKRSQSPLISAYLPRLLNRWTIKFLIIKGENQNSVKRISLAFSVIHVLPHSRGCELKRTFVRNGHPKIASSFLCDPRKRWITIYPTGPHLPDAFLHWSSPVILLPFLAMSILGATLISKEKLHFVGSKHILASPPGKDSFARQCKRARVATLGRWAQITENDEYQSA